MTLLIIAGIVGYALCSLLTYKATFAYFQKEYASINSPEHMFQDRAVGVLMALSGPIGLLMLFFLSRGFKHGFTVHD